MGTFFLTFFFVNGFLSCESFIAKKKYDRLVTNITIYIYIILFLEIYEYYLKQTKYLTHLK